MSAREPGEARRAPASSAHERARRTDKLLAGELQRALERRDYARALSLAQGSSVAFAFEHLANALIGGLGQRYGEQARAQLVVCGVRAHPSRCLLYDTRERCVHIWPEGDDGRGLPAPSGYTTHTLCGLRALRGEMLPSLGGIWQAPGAGMRRCPDCERTFATRSAPFFAELRVREHWMEDIEETREEMPFGARDMPGFASRLHRELVRALRALPGAQAFSPAPSADPFGAVLGARRGAKDPDAELRRAGMRAFARALVDTAVELVMREPERALGWTLDYYEERAAFAQVAGVEVSQLAALLGESDWRELLSAALGADLDDELAVDAALEAFPEALRERLADRCAEHSAR